ncbi:hypothetical protein LUZ63_015785 [Rhynchospora breviuscula]|uniref:F-box domain-containing protein n=1 Tax=Rhynchospora breviuscula TaxID=2022672 RepID=A0A9Q0CD30_9POAL|nr:hypothetical protein LUZ63_015785 [Rhynchospora breviuscula]
MARADNSRRGDRDRLSSLPDCLIHLIMSFLTAQEAVRTCILSKRWKNLWTTLPFLDFDWRKSKYDRKWDPDEWDYSEYQIHKLEKFRDFVTMTLLLREPSELHKFRLSFLDGEFYDLCRYDIFIRSWILHALKYNLQVLHFSFSRYYDPYPQGSLHLGIFTCASLVDASLHSTISVRNIEVINLPCLKRLHLKMIALSQNFVGKLFCGCPVLELLHLENCGAERFSTNSKSLKHLKVENGCWGGDSEKSMELIDTPNLVSLYYPMCPYIFDQCKMLLKMPSLTSASIHSHYHYRGQSNVLIGLSNVQYLVLFGENIKGAMEIELPNCPVFSNLKNLSVNNLCLRCHFNILASFLSHCPNLEKLSLCYLGCYCKWDALGNQESLKIAPFEGKRLQTVEVKFSRSDRNFPQDHEVFTGYH